MLLLLLLLLPLPLLLLLLLLLPLLLHTGMVKIERLEYRECGHEELWYEDVGTLKNLKYFVNQPFLIFSLLSQQL